MKPEGETTRDRRLDEVVAIKVLRPDFDSDPEMATRFRSETRNRSTVSG